MFVAMYPPCFLQYDMSSFCDAVVVLVISLRHVGDRWHCYSRLLRKSRISRSTPEAAAELNLEANLQHEHADLENDRARSPKH